MSVYYFFRIAMGPIITLIRGLHVYQVELDANSNLRLELDDWWMGINPNRYSVAV